ncbi:unnamed protein product [Schistosoma turkestanicum]|nr:unnamed protein product [Schistosoma turkestanicum]
MTSGAPGPNENGQVARSPLVHKGRVYHPYIKREFCAQSIKMYFNRPSNCNSSFTNDRYSACDQEPLKKSFTHQITCVQNYELSTIGRQCVIGSFQGFYQFIYYNWLDKVFSGVSMMTVAKKVVLDEVLIGPISLVIFFFYNGFCDTFTVAGAVERCRQSFISAYLSDLAYWPVLQTINFAFVPSSYRVLYVIFFTSLWNTYLCFFNARMNRSDTASLEDNEQKKDCR